MTTMNKRTFTVKVDGKDVELCVIRPTTEVEQKAQIVYSKAFAELVKNGALLRQKLEAVMREQKLWDDEKEAKYSELIKRIVQNLKIVEGKVPGTSLKKAKEAAIQIRRDRMDMQELLSDRGDNEGATAEGQAEQAKFNYLASVCTVYSTTGKSFFSSLEDYMGREDGTQAKAAAEFAMLYYGFDPDAVKNRPENQFLLKYKFCNDKLDLVDSKGRPVDTKGRLINEEGRLINEANELVDEDGNKLESETTFPFIDDEGRPIITEPEPEPAKATSESPPTVAA